MNQIKGFFQRLKDAVVRLMPTGHGNHAVDTMFPHMQERHLANGRNGSYQSYAGRSLDGGERQKVGPQASPEQLLMFATILHSTKKATAAEYMAIRERIVGD